MSCMAERRSSWRSIPADRRVSLDLKWRYSAPDPPPGDGSRERPIGFLTDRERELRDAGNSAGHHIAGLHGADTGRRAAEDQITRCEIDRGRDGTDDLRHRPDQLGEIPALLEIAVDAQPDFAVVGVADVGHGVDRRRRGRRVEALGPVPRPTQPLGLVLQVAPGQVDADAVAPTPGSARRQAPRRGRRTLALRRVRSRDGTPRSAMGRESCLRRRRRRRPAS
jgi:hypothetical protein